jgi:Protein of unknown function (DUF4232)
MKFFSTTARRIAAITAATVAAGLIATTAALATTSAASTAAAIPRCTAAGLGVWVAVDQGNGAAGTIYYPLEFTNLSGHTCYLYGYPGVSVLDHNGHQLGSPASWGSPAGARIVNLAPGATAHTVLAYHDAAVTTELGCDSVQTAAQLRVYPPGQKSSTDAEFDLQSCSHAGPIYLSITKPIIPGVGTIYG